MNMPAKPATQVVIVGGGPVGLGLAIDLGQRGVSCVLVERNLADLRAVGLGDTAEDVLQSLKKVRKAGVCVAYGEVTPGAVGIAAPVVDDRDYPIASVCVTIAGNQVTGAQIDQIGAEVRRVAAQISADQAGVKT